jgi:aspartyl-tRNA(Asn)/glutamyl-tRNA(Gln) amidotransferase subunit C
MAIARDEVLKIAHLARLSLNDEEVEVLARDLGTIVDYVRQLQTIDTRQVEPFSQVVELHGVFREDEPAPSLSEDAALANAPARQGNLYRVPGVFET